MATEAHKLIGISLSKIAQSRASRSGVSLHKNLLVATVLHKARYIFMEEAYHLVHGNSKSLKQSNERHLCHQLDINETKTLIQTANKSYEDDWNISEVQNKHLEKEVESDVIECQQSYKLSSPPSYQAHIELTYLNLDESSIENEQSSQKFSDSKVTIESQENNALKRRHSEWEIEEAVLSILPKRTKSQSENDNESSENNDDFVFLNDPAFLTDNERLIATPASEEHHEPSMEIDRLSSLVSFFSFTTNLTSDTSCDDLACKSQSTISVSNPDLCSAQAKETNEVLQPPIQYLAMTV